MSAKDILIKAVQCDQAGRILEAQYNYQEGIECLMELVEGKREKKQLVCGFFFDEL